ncbi:type II toxin-antitoxin system Phd/YefM family antitoxin [bacterium]|nr:type II toxin-antitoxin system Phd/YefM family antitoxin [bacterium]MBP5627108.1 type II toxin-antitoxin system Phd/YefM family antitoxin [bacterium]
MLVDTKDIVTMTEANKNFSEVARRTDRDGKTVIFKNNKPKYIVISLTEGNYIDLTDDERFEIVAKRIMRRHKAAFLELAK